MSLAALMAQREASVARPEPETVVQLMPAPVEKIAEDSMPTAERY